MNETERLTAGALLTLLLFLIPAYLLHVVDDFAGSLAGFLLGATATTLMISALSYPLLKYSPVIKSAFGSFASLRGLLSAHVYIGVIAAFVGTLHTGHKFESPIGVALVILMLIVITTGFVGRYYFPRSLAELRDAQTRLATLRSSFDIAARDIAQAQQNEALGNTSVQIVDGITISNLLDSIADLEHYIGSRQAMKAVLARWMIAHVAASILFLAILTVHIAGEVYYGLRWIG